MPEGEVALALAELRSTLEVGFARMDGQLAVVVQRSDQTDKAVEDLTVRVSALEKSRWPLPTILALTSVVGTAVAVLALVKS
ncbi:hypothetical protein [Streptomyces fractus]|uniref:hypothetical protein n=1 Tax=Streptomyces fractus TaxID=641806 RepID=UPI003CE8F148